MPPASSIDWHLDRGASQFLTKQVQVGLVGYVYDRVTPDRGCAPIICPFESRSLGVGPQFSHSKQAAHSITSEISPRQFSFLVPLFLLSSRLRRSGQPGASQPPMSSALELERATVSCRKP